MSTIGNFSGRVRDVISYSREEAIRVGVDYIGTEHLLLGILREGNGIAVTILRDLGCDLDSLKEKIDQRFPLFELIPLSGNIPLTKTAEKVLKTSYLEAKLYKGDVIGTEHLLLAILRAGDGVASALLRQQCAVGYDAARSELDRILSDAPRQSSTDTPGTPEPSPEQETAAKSLTQSDVEALVAELNSEGRAVLAGDSAEDRAAEKQKAVIDALWANKSSAASREEWFTEMEAAQARLQRLEARIERRADILQLARDIQARIEVQRAEQAQALGRKDYALAFDSEKRLLRLTDAQAVLEARVLVESEIESLRTQKNKMVHTQKFEEAIQLRAAESDHLRTLDALEAMDVSAVLLETPPPRVASQSPQSQDDTAGVGPADVSEPPRTDAVSPTGGVFISYRRRDASYAASQIYDTLANTLGPEAVFKDVDSIPPGVDFRDHIDQAVQGCGVFLAVISPSWTERLDDPDDFVRIEIEAALVRDIPVIPLFIHGAEMPRAESLPNSLRTLVYRNGLPLRAGRDSRQDLDRLVASIAKTGTPKT